MTVAVLVGMTIAVVVGMAIAVLIGTTVEVVIRQGVKFRTLVSPIQWSGWQNKKRYVLEDGDFF